MRKSVGPERLLFDSSSSEADNERIRTDNGENTILDEFGQDLMGDDEDRARLMSMTEVEREAIIYERAQARAERQERKLLRAKLASRKEAVHGKQAPSARVPEKPAPQEERPAHKKSLPSTPDLSFEDARSIYVTRQFVERFLFYPSFEEITAGCFVRIKLGDSVKNEYRLALVDEFRALPKYYSFANASINLACIASHGNSRKAFTFDFLSNSPFTAEEFDSWMQRAVSDRAALPTKALCLRKSSQIEDLASSTMSDALIDLILKRKRKLCVAKDTEGGESEKAVASKPALHHAAKKPRYVSSIPIEKKATSNSSFDPFSRRKCKPVLIHDSDSSSTRPPKPPITGQASTDRQHSSGEATPRQSEDLFVAHEKLDLDL